MSLSTAKISNSVLWLCMVTTITIFALFYFSGSTEVPGSDISEPKQTSLLLYWTNIILVLALAVLLGFSVVRFYKKIKNDPRSAWKSMILFISLTALFFVTYMIGNGTPLVISGYEGNENTPPWLKLTDMWLYSIYTLLILAVLAAFGGIIWSYIKKIK